MKLWHCDWVPASVADWLCGELEEKGIPGTTYTHTLFSLLHPYFCPHPVPRVDSTSFSQQVSLQGGFENIKSPHFEDIEEFTAPIHPDADFPELEIPKSSNENNRRAKRKHKRKLQELSSSPQKAWKAAALQCLAPATDELEQFKDLINELFIRLEKVEISETVTAKNIEEFSPKQNKRKFDIPVDITLSSDFPPLTLSEKSELCDLTDVSINSPRSRKNVRRALFQNDMNNSFGLVSSKKKTIEMELGFNQGSYDNPNDVKFPGMKFSLVESAVKDCNLVTNEGGIHSWTQVVDKRMPFNDQKLEEWECAEMLGDTASSFEHSGNRLFERSIDIPGRIRPDIQHGSIMGEFFSKSWSCHHDWNDKSQDHQFPEANSNNLFSDLPQSDVLPIERKNQTAYFNWNDQYSSISSTGDVWSQTKTWNSLPPDGLKLKVAEDHNIEKLAVQATLKNIPENTCGNTNWSDNNKNISLLTDTSTNEPKANDHSLLTDKEMCESFKQLNLENLWRKTPSEMAFDAFSMRENSDLKQSDQYILKNIDSTDKFQINNEESKGISDNIFIPSGPSGPTADLKHTETSGFTSVVPHKSQIETFAEAELKTIKDSKQNEDKNDFSCQEEENLLTSPRTHFKPIRQDSYGSCTDDNKSDDNQLISGLSGFQNPDLVFQRTGSGNLFLEVDILEGSPKKYMVYKEPNKPAQNAEYSETNENPLTSSYSDSTTSSPFVPKFKLINNEKFCQTEQEIDSTPKEFIPLFEGKEGRELRFEHMLEGSVKYLWKTESPKSANNFLWNSHNEKEAWEFDPSSCNLLTKYSFLNDDHQSWSHEENFESVKKNEKLEGGLVTGNSNVYDLNNEDSFSKMKFIWMNKKENKSNVNDTNVYSPHLTNIPSDAWDSKSPLNMSNDEEGPIGDGLFDSTNPWNVLKKDSLTISSDNLKETKEPLTRWELQWEIKQETDKILGKLPPPSPLNSSPEKNLLNFLDNKDKEEFLEDPKQSQPVEDLDNIEPEWDLNDGFEWDHPTEEEIDGDESGQEILVYETEDGQTVMVPVEYLEDSLYDEIFGAPNNPPFGGSLPTLSGDLDGKNGKVSYKIPRRVRGSHLQQHSRRPCSYFIEGNCRRSDCKFSHDLSSITCRFWEEGSCFKGEVCPFLHGHDLPPRRRNRSEGDQSFSESLNFAKLRDKSSTASKSRPVPKGQKFTTSNLFEIDSEADFPSLSSSLESKVSNLEDVMLASKPRVTKLSKKKQKFITVTKSMLKEIGNRKEKLQNVKGSSQTHRRSKKSGYHSTQPGSDDTTKGCEKRSECLRKILKKHSSLPKSFNHEDGSLSDY